MSGMRFSRFPVLAGRNLIRQRTATLRGSVRRSDPDITSVVPYFPLLSAGQTLQVQTQGGTVTATFTSNALASVLSELNSALSGNAVARDDFGAITITSSQTGGTGFVEVLGGTAAKALGFYVPGFRMRAVGGEIESSPENGVGNPAGTAMPARQENLTVESVQRITGRLGENLDVLASVAEQERPLLQRVTGYTISADGKTVTLPSSTRVFVGTGGLLNSSSDAETLFPWFQILDSTTLRPSTSRVVGVVRGTVTGNPPYANALAWSGINSSGNVLGRSLIKFQGGITEVTPAGLGARCSGADFSSIGVLPGDYAEVLNATNTDPFNHNGHRWIVESIPSPDTVVLRPMSQGEFSGFGGSFPEEQPVLQLNESKTSSTSFGTLVIRSGPFINGAKLILDPPLQTEGVWVMAALPAKDSSRTISDDAVAASRLEKWSTEVHDPMPGAILDGFTVTYDLEFLSVDAGRVRWRGRDQFFPGVSWHMADAGFVPGENFIYWDHLSGTLGHTNIPSDSFFLSTSGAQRELLAVIYLVDNGDGTFDVDDLVTTPRKGAEDVRTLTVGVGGQFEDLGTAIGYVNTLSYAKGETDTLSGTYPRFEIVVLSDIVLSSPVVVRTTGLTIRGGSRNVSLIADFGNMYIFYSRATDGLTIQDLKVKNTLPGNSLVDLALEECSVSLVRVVHDASNGNALLSVVNGGAGSAAKRVEMDGCDFSCGGGVLWGLISEAYLERSVFRYLAIAGRTTTQILCGSYYGPAANQTTNFSHLSVSHCQFLGWQTATGGSTIPLFIYENGSGQLSIENSSFTFGSGNSATAELTRIVSAMFTMRSCRVGSTTQEIYTAINADSVLSTVENCVIYVKAGAGREGPAVLAGTVTSTKIYVGGTEFNVPRRGRSTSGGGIGSLGLVLLTEYAEGGTPATAGRQVKIREYRDASGSYWITSNALCLSTDFWSPDNDTVVATAVRFGPSLRGKMTSAYPPGGLVSMASLLGTYQPFVSPDDAVTWTAKHIFNHADGIQVVNEANVGSLKTNNIKPQTTDGVIAIPGKLNLTGPNGNIDLPTTGTVLAGHINGQISVAGNTVSSTLNTYVGRDLNVTRNTVLGYVEVNGDLDAYGDINVPYGQINGTHNGPVIREAARVVGAGGQPAYAGTWAGTSYFWKDPMGIVYVYINASPGSGGATGTIFTLPAGYRSSQTLRFVTSRWKATATAGLEEVLTLEMNTSGDIYTLTGGANGFGATYSGPALCAFFAFPAA